MSKVMDRIEVGLGGYPPEGISYTGIEATNRQAIIDLLDETKKLKGDKGCFEITMPCGYSKKFEEYADIPQEDLPCPCGRKKRYLIRYKKEGDMKQEIVARVKLSTDKPQVIVRKAIFNEDGTVERKYGLSMYGGWIEVPEATTYPNECYLPVALHIT